MDVDASTPADAAALGTATGAAPSFEFEAPSETNRVIFARHAKEWKEMKVRVASLKRDRKKIPKKGNKEKKKNISKEIRKSVQELRKKHEEELKAAGVIGGAPPVPDGLMDDVEDDDD